MSRITFASFSLALPAALMAQTALADVTAAEVWSDWKEYMQTMGYTVQGTETANGDNLTVSDITMGMQIPDNAGAFSMALGDVTFAQNGGSVDVIMPDSMPLNMTIEPTPGEPEVTLQFTYAQSGQAMNVSGSSEEMVSTYTADTISLTLDELVAEGKVMGPDMMKMVFSLSGMDNTTTMKIGDVRDYRQVGSVDALTYDIDVNIPEEQSTFKMTGGIDGLTFDGGGVIPTTGVDMTDMAAMLKSGFSAGGTFTYAGGNTQLAGNSPADGEFAATSSSSGGNLGVEMNADKLAYSGEQNDLKVNVSVPDLPFPIDLSMDKGAFNLAMPISKSDTPEDFGFGITLGNFVMSDLIWSMFDPAQQLPRDPATIQLDLSGQAKMLVDLMDPEQAASTEVPGEIHALTVDKLLVKAVGAKLEGTGDITFDNTDMVTIPGMPKPVGAIDLSLNGANGLIDKLVGMGLLPEEQAMGARMMMGLFAVPGSEPDSLTSKVEFTEEGQILANGQRIK